MPYTIQCAGVIFRYSRPMVRASASAPASMSILTMRGLPEIAAVCSGVSPAGDRSMTSWPSESRRSTSVMLPSPAAKTSGMLVFIICSASSLATWISRIFSRSAVSFCSNWNGPLKNRTTHAPTMINPK